MTSNQLGDANELARRFVACKGWRWLGGMAYRTISSKGMELPERRVTGSGAELHAILPIADGYQTWEMLPDLSDAATRGAILELVRVAWGGETAYVVSANCASGIEWCVVVARPFAAKYTTLPRFGCGSEVKALLAALEAAP